MTIDDFRLLVEELVEHALGPTDPRVHQHLGQVTQAIAENFKVDRSGTSDASPKATITAKEFRENALSEPSPFDAPARLGLELPSLRDELERLVAFVAFQAASPRSPA